MGAALQAALVRPAPGERTISNAEVPLPRSPLSLAAGTAHRKACSIGFALKRRLPAALGTCLSGTISAANGLMQGCRGRSPRRNKVIFPPSRWEGGRGDGGEKNAKGRVGGRGRRHTPRRARGSLPVPVPPPAQARGCKGRSPLHKNNLSLPLPHRGRGLGGIGERNQAKGRVGGRGERQAPPRVPEWQGRQATSPPAPPAGDSGGRKLSAPVRRLSLLHKSGGNIWYRLRIDGGGGNLYNRKGDL